jgi:hypothetical protein
MGLKAVEQVGWGFCSSCGRTTRQGRNRAVWPASAPPPWLWLRLRLHDHLLGRWHCLEHGRAARPGPVTTFEAQTPGGSIL